MESAKPALILFSHGSLLCGAGEALEAHAERLRATNGWSHVAIGYLNYSPPLFGETVAELAARGVREAVVAPYFLAPGYFVGRSLPAAVAAAREQHPEMAFAVADALGEDDSLADALLAAAIDSHPPTEWDDPLHRATTACRLSPTCPLFGTPDCPRRAELSERE